MREAETESVCMSEREEREWVTGWLGVNMRWGGQCYVSPPAPAPLAGRQECIFIIALRFGIVGMMIYIYYYIIIIYIIIYYIILCCVYVAFMIDFVI